MTVSIKWMIKYNVENEKSLSWESVARTCSLKKMFLKILQNSQGTPVSESLF